MSMKILHISQSYTQLGGTEQYIIALTHLFKKDHENIVVYRQDHPATIKDKNTFSIYLPPTASYKDTFNSIKQIVKDNAVDISMLHQVYEPELITATLAVGPTIGYIHNFIPTCPAETKLFRHPDEICTHPFNNKCAALIYFRRCSEARNPLTVRQLLNNKSKIKEAYQSLKHILVASHYMRDLLIQNGFTANKIDILPPHFENPHDIVEPQRKPRLLLFVGRLEIEKGFPYLLKAFSKVKNESHLLVVGDGTQRVKYENMVNRVGLQSKTTFLGWLGQPELHKLYDQASLVVLPSIYPEPFGKVGIEAMSHSRAVIAFNVGGISDWLQDGINGYLIAPLDVDQLSNRIDSLLSDDELMLKMGINGHKLSNAIYSPEQHRSRLENIFSESIRVYNQE